MEGVAGYSGSAEDGRPPGAGPEGIGTGDRPIGTGVYGMINLLTESISRALQMEFGDGYTIYRAEVQQGLQGPCFFIACGNPVIRLLRQDRYLQESQYCIRYVPEPGVDEKEACHETAERLFTCLRWLDCAGVPVMGTGMKYEVSDGILHFSVNYNTFRKRSGTPVAPMEELAAQVSAKGETEK